MCEFTVILTEKDGEEKIAEDIVRTSYLNGELVLMDILGDRIPVGGALIKEINVDLKKPRDRNSEEFIEVKRIVNLSLLNRV